MNRSTLLKYLKIAGAFVLLAIGLVLSLPGIPGPGIALILAALVILSAYFAWARKLLDWAKAKFRKFTSR